MKRSDVSKFIIFIEKKGVEVIAKPWRRFGGQCDGRTIYVDIDPRRKSDHIVAVIAHEYGHIRLGHHRANSRYATIAYDSQYVFDCEQAAWHEAFKLLRRKHMLTPMMERYAVDCLDSYRPGGMP